MYGTVAPIRAKNPADARRVADYYTHVRGHAVQLTAEDLAYITGYYGAGAENSIAEFSGSGVRALGFEPGQTATREQLFALLQGIDPQFGTPLRDPSTKGRPPSVSAYDQVIALEGDASHYAALLGEQGARDAEEAIRYGREMQLKYLEEEGAVVRRGANGVVHCQADGLIVISTMHFSARPVDGVAAPHVHSHTLVINGGRGPDGKWTALDGIRFFELQITGGAIAGAASRQFLAERWGIEWEKEITEKGTVVHRIVGFTPELRKEIGHRQNQINEAMRDQGLDKYAAQKKTKESKTKDACGDIRDWLAMGQRLEDHGFTAPGVLAQCHAEQARRHELAQQALTDRRLLTGVFGDAPTNQQELRDWRVEAAKYFYRTENRLDYSWGGYDKLDFARIDRALEAQTLTPDERIRLALDEVGRRRSTYREHHLVRAAVDEGLLLDEAMEHVRRYIRDGHAIAIHGIDRDETPFPEGYRPRFEDTALFASRQTLEAERDLLQQTRAGIGARKPLVDERKFAKVIAEMEKRGKLIEPESDQYQMLRQVLCGGDAVTVVTGQAGSGKSAGFEALNLVSEGLGLLHRDGVQVVGCSLGSLAAQNLMAESGIESTSIAMMLYRLEHGILELEPGAVIVVDECSQASTQQLHELLGYVQEVDGRLCLVGDWRQLKAIEAGDLYRDLVEHVPEAVSWLNEIRRQETFAERVVLSYLHDNGELSQRSLAALIRQAGIEVCGTLEPLEVLLTHAGLDDYFLRDPNERTGKRKPLSPTEALEGALKWYRDNGRLHFADKPEELAQGIATQYWDRVEVGLDRGLSLEVAERRALVLAQRNEDTELIDRAIVGEALRRGHLTATSALTVNEKTYFVGQRIAYRGLQYTGLNPAQHKLNGHNYIIDGWVDAPVTWDLKLQMPWGVAWTREFAGVEPPDVATVKLTRGQVEKARESALKWRQRCRQNLGQSKSPEANRKWRRELRSAAKGYRAAKKLPDRGGVIEVPVLEQRAVARDRRLRVHLDDGSHRYLSEADMAQTSPGFVRTDQVLQGQTVTEGISYGPNYVGVSRGRLSNHIWEMPDQIAYNSLREARDEAVKHIERLSAALGASDAIRELSVVATKEALAHGAVGEVAVHVGATPTHVQWALAAEVADRYAQSLEDPLAPRVVAVARSRDMADDINKRVLGALAAKGIVGQSFEVHGQRYAVGAPVLIRHDVKSLGLRANTEALIVDVAEDLHLKVALPNGKTVALNPVQVERHLEPALSVTALRAPQLNADGFLALGAGLDAEQVAAFRERGQFEVFLSDPDKALEIQLEDLRWNTALDHLLGDAFGEKRVSAHRAAWEHSKKEAPWEVGLPSLREQHRQAIRQLDKYRSIEDPTDLAKRIIEDRILERKKELEVVRKLDRTLRAEVGRTQPGDHERDDRQLERPVPQHEAQAPGQQGRPSVEEHERGDRPALSDETPARPDELEPETLGEREALSVAENRERRLAELAEEIRHEQARLEEVNRRQPVLDDIERARAEEQRQRILDEELAKEEERRRAVEQEIHEIKMALTRNVGIKLADAQEKPPPYAPDLPGIETGPDGRATWRADLGDIENFRMRWGVPDDAPEPLGRPVGGRQEQEWLRLSEELADRSPKIAEVLEKHRNGELEPGQLIDGPDMRIAFHKVKEGWAIRGPAEEMPEPGQTVTIHKKNGTTTEVLVQSVRREVEIRGETFREVNFVELPKEEDGPQRSRSDDDHAKRRSAERSQLDELVEKRLEEYRRRVAARSPELEIQLDGPELFVVR